MNCKPDQTAWIAVPVDLAGTGIEQIHGHIVRTIALAPAYTEPSWQVTPRPKVTLRVNGVDSLGRRRRAGEHLQAKVIPDAWLRPFDPLSAPSTETSARELELQS